MKNPAKAKMGKATTMDAKENEIIHVQRLKSVKLYNNHMDETTSDRQTDFRINIKKLIETGDCKSPEENSQYEKSL